MRKTMALTLTVISISVVNFAVIILIAWMYTRLPLHSVIILAAVLATMLAVVSLKLTVPIRMFFEGVFYGQTYLPRQDLLNFAARMGNILNLSQFASALLLILTKAIRVSHCVLLLEDSAGSGFTTRFQCPKAPGDAVNNVHLKPNSPIVVLLHRESRPLSVRQLNNAQKPEAIEPTESSMLANLVFLFPIKSHGKLIAILGLGKKQSNKVYSKDDLAVVQKTADQAGVMLENAVLYEELVRRATSLQNQKDKTDQY